MKGRIWSGWPRFFTWVNLLLVFLIAVVVFKMVKLGRDGAEDLAMVEAPSAVNDERRSAFEDLLAANEEEEKAPAVLPEPTVEISSSPKVPLVDRRTEAVPAKEDGPIRPTERIDEDVPEVRESVAEEDRPLEKKASLAGKYTIHVASFRKKVTCDRYMKELRGQGYEAYGWEIDLPEKGRWHRVSIGAFPSRREAESFVSANNLKEKFYVFITRHRGP